MSASNRFDSQLLTLNVPSCAFNVTVSLRYHSAKQTESALLAQPDRSIVDH